MTKVGTHCLVELYNCPPALLNDKQHITETLREAALRAKSTLLQEVVQTFEPHGVTGLALLAESHISIHTWPETGYAAIDVFTCGEHTLPEEAGRYMARSMKAGKAVMVRTQRGLPNHRIEPFGMADAVVEPAPGSGNDDSDQEGERCQVLKYAQISG